MHVDSACVEINFIVDDLTFEESSRQARDPLSKQILGTLATPSTAHEGVCWDAIMKKWRAGCGLRVAGGLAVDIGCIDTEDEAQADFNKVKVALPSQ